MYLVERLPIEDLKRKVDNAKWFNFGRLPIDNVDKSDVVKSIGFIPFMLIELDYEWESTIAYWCNRLHEFSKNPYELKRLDKSQYDEWLPIYEYVVRKTLSS